MLRLLVASARIPEATGAGPGVHVSARFRDTLTLRLRRWGQPVPQGALGAATVSLEQLVANPGLPLSLSHVPLLDPQGQPTGVRVRVIEGHQLQGNDIKPVVTVLIGQKRFRTRIQTGNNPYYNEVFWQNFRRTPARLAAELIVFQVLDSRATRAKAIIGIFQVGTVTRGCGVTARLGHPHSLCPPQLDIGTIYHAPADPPRLPVGGKRGFVAAAVRVRFAGRTDIGVAYRGRVLLELSTHMGTPDGRQRGAIAPEDVSRVQRHLPQCRRFGLCGVFYSATMVPPGPELLRFELSLGHYGDTSDATCKPTASVTPHCCPLFDGEWDAGTGTQWVTPCGVPRDALGPGNRYHYLPWYGDKPVAAVTSSWEDAGDRWDTLNLLRSVCRRLALAWLEEQPTPTVLDAHLRTARLHLLRHLVATAAEPPRAGWDTLLDTAQGWLRRVTALAVEGSSDIRAQLRLRLWLGRVANSGDLTRHLEGTLHVYAETYENQTKLLGKWGPRGLLGCPCFSDSAGKAGLPRHRIRPPRGWRWDGPWTVEPQRRLLLDAETNVGEVLEEVYENESRQRGGEWGPAAVTSTDVSGAAVPPKEEVACPQGWHIAHDWHVDVTGAVDEAGPNFFQLRCYIFQALELAPRATKATADPVAHVSFVHVSQSTRVLPGTLDPLWDQTLLFQRVLLYGDPQGVQDEPPMVVVEVFDQDGGVLAWGLRGLQGGVRAPSLELQCGGQTLRTPPILNLPTNPNFPINAFLLPLAAEEEEEEDEDDWWSKFYAAMGDKAKRRTGRDRLKIYSCELEALPEFEGLQDFCQTFPLYAPGGHPTVGDDPVGEFKVGDTPEGTPQHQGGDSQGCMAGRLSQGLFRIYPLPEDPAVSPPPRHFQQLPPSQPQKCLVRVYVVRAFDLPPKDRNRLCDPYVRVSLGKKQLGQRDQYVPNTLEPVFGRLFEVTGTIPLEKDLRVTLLDYDVVPPDQEIGTTTIDLENRLLSHYRANCGLAARYRTYELRCVVWNTQDVDMGDVNLIGQQMSDIYVMGWLDGLEEQRQRTDIHYRSLLGEGAFNWRFVFSFQCLAAEELCILPRKARDTPGCGCQGGGGHMGQR
ncbi:fer-1-like protein 5 [Patagioenas fasciata monilis]|uniref:Fer-1-like protein 5 n=1 Tax=Patagioenas fasciata monilis TaxID=372326 RepID=A0A1V4KR63_PATFA|nr:fer-1-like protein 5 [Patagioenas fasciata monilis]